MLRELMELASEMAEVENASSVCRLHGCLADDIRRLTEEMERRRRAEKSFMAQTARDIAELREYVDTLDRLHAQLLGILKTFTDAEWHDVGHGIFEARLPAEVITNAKAALAN